MHDQGGNGNGRIPTEGFRPACSPSGSLAPEHRRLGLFFLEGEHWFRATDDTAPTVSRVSRTATVGTRLG